MKDVRRGIPDISSSEADISTRMEKLFTVKGLPINTWHAESVEEYIVEEILQLKKLEVLNLQVIEQQKSEIARLKVETMEETKTVSFLCYYFSSIRLWNA